MQLRSKIAAAAVVAGIAASAVILGVAAPAEAFQAPPVGPPKLNVPSSVISDAVGGSGTSGAQLGGQLAQAGGKLGSPAFAASSMTKAVGSVSQLVSAFNLGGTIGGAVDGAFGIDRDGTVCGSSGDDVGGNILRFLSGADCGAYKPPTAYVPNTDAVAQAAGFLNNYYYWGGKSTPGAWVARFTGPDGATASQTLTLTATNVSGSANPMNTTVFGALCRPATGNAYLAYRTATVPIGFTGTQTWTFSCNAGEYVQGVGRASSSATTWSSEDMENYGTGPAWYLNTDGDDPAYVTQFSPAWRPATTSNPTRWKVCTIATTDGGSYTAQTANFLETDAAWPADNCPVIPGGKTAGHMTITLNGGPSVITLSSVDSTPAYQAAQTAYPNCANGTCTLDLIDATGSCYDGDSSRCATWVEDPDRDSKYTCKYGTYTAPLKECFALGNAFDPIKVAAGDGMASPGDGTDTKTQTSVKPSTGSGPSADPATGNDRADCWPSGWAAFNPLNWVLQPLQCAFSPRTSAVVATETQVSTAWKNSSVGVLGTAVSGFFLTSPTSGCQGITIDTSWIGGGGYIKGAPTSVHMLAACPGDYFEHIAPIVNGLLTAGIAIMAVLALARLLGRFAGYSGVSGE